MGVACSKIPRPPVVTSIRSLLDDLNVAIKPNDCFKEHLTKVHDMAEFESKYNVGVLLGQGITGQVHEVSAKYDKAEKYAMKSINVDQLDSSQIYELRREIDTLRLLDHPNIISLNEVFQSPKNLVIIMEHCSGGDLGHRKFTSETQVLSVVFQLAEAIAHCHHQGVVHRDLKMENIMFASPNSDSVRLIDFGLSKRFLSQKEILSSDSERRVMQTACGTAFYMAPEMLKNTYSEKADIWALGVIVYMILVGKPPFEGRDEKTVFAKLKRGQVNYEDRVWTKLSPEAKDFVKRLLCVDPKKRPSAKQVLQLPWLETYSQKRCSDRACAREGQAFAQSVSESLFRFATYSLVKRFALIAVAHHLQEKDTRALRDFFLILDEDHSGVLVFEEVHKNLQKQCGFTIGREYFQTVFDGMDTEHEGKVHYMEFLAATLESCVTPSKEIINQAFDDFSHDDFGCIQPETLVKMMGKKWTLKQAEGLLLSGRQCCGLCPGKGITREEFMVLMSPPKPLPLLALSRQETEELQRLKAIEEAKYSDEDESTGSSYEFSSVAVPSNQQIAIC